MTMAEPAALADGAGWGGAGASKALLPGCFTGIGISIDVPSYICALTSG